MVSIALGVLLGIGYLLTGISSVTLLSSYTIAMTLLAAYRRHSLLRSSLGVDRPPGRINA